MKNKGQSAIEYFVIFSVIALLTILSFSSFFPRIQGAMQGEAGYFQRAAQQIISPTLVTQTPTPPTTSSTPPPPTPPIIPQLAPGLPPLTPPSEPLPWHSSTPLIIPPTVTTDPYIIAALNILNGTELGAYYVRLIIDNNILIQYRDRADNFLGAWDSYGNSIWLSTAWLNEIERRHPERISVILVHEAVHADYTYNPQRWKDYLRLRHPEVPSNSIPKNSIDQEYNATSVGILTNEALLAVYPESSIVWPPQMYHQGESYLKDWIRGVAPYYTSLPEY